VARHGSDVRRPQPVTERAPPYGAAALAGAAVLVLYAGTLAPTTAFWDASEYIATAHILGIPHPPGNPLFVALGKVWLLLLSPLPLTVAQRVNLFAAATSAGAFAFLFLVARRLLLPLVEREVVARVGAAVSVLLGATAFTVWSQSNVNEKVYTVSLFVLAASTWLALRWYDRQGEEGGLRCLVGALYLMALGSTSHLMSILAAPALLALVLLVRPGTLRRTPFWSRGVAAVVVGLSFNAFLPIRAAQEPVINEGAPRCDGAASAAVAIYTQGRAGCGPLAANLTREQYRKPPLTDRQAPFGHQLRNWFQYFGWQWARGASPDPRPGTGRLPYTVLFGALGLLGLWSVGRRDRALFAYFGVLVFTLTVALVAYLNFRYGYSLAPETAELGAREVRERDYFFIAGFAFWGILAGVGLTLLWTTVARALPGRRGHLLASPLLGIALLPLALNAAWADRSGDYAARDWAFDLLTSVEPYGVLFTNGDNDTFPLWYLQEVEGIRKDVTVVVGQYLYTDWYPRQLRKLTAPCPPGTDPEARPTVIVCQRPFEAVGGEASPHPPPPFVPGGSILAAPPERLDRIAGGVLARDTVFDLGTLAVTYPEGAYLGRGDRLVLRIIGDVGGRRPVYFATRGGLMRDLGLDPWGIRHGLVTKLALRSLEDPPPPGVVRADAELGGEWFDVDRSLELVRGVYRYRSLAGREIWADRSTLNIPWQYYALFLQLSDVAAASQAPVTAEELAELRRRAEAFLVSARGGRVVVGGGGSRSP